VNWEVFLWKIHCISTKHRTTYIR